MQVNDEEIYKLLAELGELPDLEAHPIASDELLITRRKS